MRSSKPTPRTFPVDGAMLSAAASVARSRTEVAPGCPSSPSCSSWRREGHPCRRIELHSTCVVLTKAGRRATGSYGEVEARGVKGRMWL